ncbi:hypothetical protein ACGRHY_10250 [Streptomyces sp. HK10]|uniref:hypothetical protein n=1 Tax=Streptomyces sp. HK10 TaxID=3373255 RepID=UPI00374A585F
MLPGLELLPGCERLGHQATGDHREERDAQEAEVAFNMAQSQQAAAQRRVKRAVKELVEIAKDILGINAAMDCFSSGDLAACGETADRG